jgi:hypothetical protein
MKNCPADTLYFEIERTMKVFSTHQLRPEKKNGKRSQRCRCGGKKRADIEAARRQLQRLTSYQSSSYRVGDP